MSNESMKLEEAILDLIMNAVADGMSADDALSACELALSRASENIE